MDKDVIIGTMEFPRDYEVGYLQGMQDLATWIINGLKSAKNEDVVIETALGLLGSAFEWEIICRGDVMPFEFEECWKDALGNVKPLAPNRPSSA